MNIMSHACIRSHVFDLLKNDSVLVFAYLQLTVNSVTIATIMQG